MVVTPLVNVVGTFVLLGTGIVVSKIEVAME